MVTYYIYVLASRRHGTLYVGVTNSLERRIGERKAKAAAGFTKRYDVNRLVWWRAFEGVARRSALRSSSSAGGATGGSR